MKRNIIIKKQINPVFNAKSVLKNITIFFGLGLVAVNCSSDQNNQKELAQPMDITEGRQVIVATDYVIDKEQSQVHWYSAEMGIDQSGTIDFTRGQLGLGEGEILGGTFKLDLNSVAASESDRAQESDEVVEKLKSEDFLAVESYPEGELEILKVSKINSDSSQSLDGLEPTHKVEAALTLRGVKRNVTFPARIEMHEGAVVTKTNQLMIEPAEWGAATSTFAEKNNENTKMRLAITITANRV